MFRAPQWHGATQTHFPPRPRNSQWHCDITNVISPHGLPIHYERFVRDVLQKSCVQSNERFARDLLQKSCFESSVSYETSSKSHASSLQNKRFVRDFLQKSHVKSPKRAFRTRLPQKSHVKSPKRAFRTRLPQKLTCQSLQNERFVRDFLQKSSGNTHRSTHITQPCQAVSRFQPLQTTPAHTPIPMSQRHSPVPQLTTSRFPAPATNLSASTRLTRIHTSKPAQSTALATKSDNIISCELQRNLYHTTRLE